MERSGIIIGKKWIDFSKPNGKYDPCNSGWYSLPKNNHSCRKCGARIGETCKSKEVNKIEYKVMGSVD